MLEHVPRPSDEVRLEEGEAEAEMEGELLPVAEGLDDAVTDGLVEICTDGDWLLVTDGGEDSSTVGLADADTDGDWLATAEGELLPVTDGIEEGPDDGLLVTQRFSTHVSPGPSQPQTKWQVKSPWQDPTQQPLSLTQSVGWLH